MESPSGAGRERVKERTLPENGSLGSPGATGKALGAPIIKGVRGDPLKGSGREMLSTNVPSMRKVRRL